MSEKRLTGLIRQERKRLSKHRFRDRLSDRLRDIYYPSFTSVLIISSLLAMIHLLIRWNTYCAGNPDTAGVARLQPLGVGVALIFVPVTVFAIGLSSRRTPSGANVAEVLLKETYLFPTAILVIGLVVNLGWVTTQLAAMALILLAFGLAILTLYFLVRVVLDEQRQYESGIQILQDKIRRSITQAVDERIGRNLLLNELKKLPLEYSSLGLGIDRERTYRVTHPKQGTVHDVLLDKLASFANQLEQKANENGYAFTEKRVPRWTEGSVLGSISGSNEKTLRVVKKRYLSVLYGERLEGGRAQIVGFPHKLVTESSDRERLTKLAITAIEVKGTESYSEGVERILADIKDQCILAIRDRRTGNLGDLLNVYSELVEVFLAEMTKLGGGYSLASARQEMQSLWGGWDEVKWIRQQLNEIHYRGCHTEDIFVALKVVAIPNRIAYAAIRSRDHLVFSEFTSFALSLYSASLEAGREDLRDLLLDHTWRYLRELGEYGIEWELKRSEGDSDSLETIGDFGTTILIRYQDLLKKACELKRVSDFETFMKAANELFGRFNVIYQAGSDIELMTVELSRPELSDDDRRQIEERIERTKALENIRKRLDSQKRQMLFGIGSLIIEKVREKPDDEDLSKLTNLVDGTLGQNGAELTELYSETQKLGVRELWGWEWWTEIPEQGGFVGDPSARLTPYYCYLLLKSTYGLSNEQIAQLKLPSDRDFIFDIGAQGRIRAMFNDFVSDRQKWGRLIPEMWLERIAPLLALFAKLTENQKRADEDQIIASSVSDDRIGDFKNSFVMEFSKAAALRGILRWFAAFKDESKAHPGQPGAAKWGINTLDDKGAYLEASERMYPDWAGNYARGCANSESVFLFDEILKKLPTCLCAGAETVEAKLLAAIQGLIDTGTKPRVILTAMGVSDSMELERSERFVPGHLERTPWKEMPGFRGQFRFNKSEVPIFQIWPLHDRNIICVMDPAKCLLLSQKSPLDGEKEFQYLHEFFYFRVADLSKDKGLRQEIQTQNPPWLQEREDKDRYLSQRVWLRVFERFAIEVLDQTAGCKIAL